MNPTARSLAQGSYLVERVRGPAWLEPALRWTVAGRRPVLSALLRLGPLRDRLLRFEYHASERVVENAWLHRWSPVPGSGAKLLDLGSAESRIPFELASLGHDVTCLDLRPYPLEHPKLRAVVGDIVRMPFEDGAFDFVSCISTIEHVGLPSYGIPGFPDGDRRTVEEIRRVLKKGGRLYLSTPLGTPGGDEARRWQRIYGLRRLEALFGGFKTVERRAYRRAEQRFWLADELETVERVVSTPDSGANGVILCLLERS